MDSRLVDLLKNADREFEASKKKISQLISIVPLVEEVRNRWYKDKTRVPNDDVDTLTINSHGTTINLWLSPDDSMEKEASLFVEEISDLLEPYTRDTTIGRVNDGWQEYDYYVKTPSWYRIDVIFWFRNSGKCKITKKVETEIREVENVSYEIECS